MSFRKTKGMIEVVPVTDRLKSSLHQSRKVHEKTRVNGFVTIIKNKGKYNEQIIQRMNPNRLSR